MIKTQLASLANESPLIRSYLEIPDWKNIHEIGKNCVTRKDGDVYTTRFFTSRKYNGVTTSNLLMKCFEEGVLRQGYKSIKNSRADELLYQLEGSFADVHSKLHWLTGTFQSDVASGAITVDGQLARGGQDEVWASMRGGAGNNAVTNSASGLMAYIEMTATTDHYGTLIRSPFTFDTSPLGNTTIVSAATLNIFGSANQSGYSDSVAVTTATLAANNNLVTADFAVANFGGSAITNSIATGSWNTSGYNTLTFSSYSFLTLDGITSVAARITSDITNSEPTWISGADASVSGIFADNGSNEPYLEVTYSKNKTLLLLGIG